MIQRFMALALKDNHALPENLEDYYPSLVVDEKSVQETLKKFSLKTESPILVLCPGAEYGPAKRWPIEYFVEVALTKLHEGWQVWLLGSTKDAVITQTMMSSTRSGCIDLAGKTTLGEVVDLLSVAQAVITNDSGLMHIADALQLPVIAMFGSTSTQFTPPLNKHAKVLETNLACRPCFKRECPLKHLQCMKDLSPKLALNKLDEILAA
jgi:heptosyltransferase-2